MLTFRVTKITTAIGDSGAEVEGKDTMDRSVTLSINRKQLTQFVAIGAAVGAWVSYDKTDNSFALAKM